MYILFREQAVCTRLQNREKACLTSVRNIAMWLYYSQAGSEATFLLFKGQMQTEVKIRFLVPSGNILCGPKQTC